MAQELLDALMSGYQNVKGTLGDLLTPEHVRAQQRLQGDLSAAGYGGGAPVQEDWQRGIMDQINMGHLYNQQQPNMARRAIEQAPMAAQQGGEALASVLAGAGGAVGDLAGNMAEGFGTRGSEQDPELGRMVQAMGAPGNPEAYRNVTERPPGYDMGRMAGQGLNAAGDMIGGAMDAVSNVDADAVLNSIMGIPGKLKEAGSEAMSSMGLDPAGEFEEISRRAQAGDPQALMQLQELSQQSGGGQAAAPQASAPQAGGGGLDPAMMQQLQQLPESKGFTLAEAHKAARAAQEAGIGREAPGFGEVVGGAVNGALGALGDRGQAAGGADLATIQQLQQILSPEEVQAVIQDPQKMAEIQALLQQGMGGQ